MRSRGWKKVRRAQASSKSFLTRTAPQKSGTEIEPNSRSPRPTSWSRPRANAGCPTAIMSLQEHAMSKRPCHDPAEKQVRELTADEITTVNGGSKIIGVRKWPNLVMKQG